MKKENIKRLLTEMIDREFDIDGIADVFSHIDHYLGEKKAVELSEDELYIGMHKESVQRWRKWTEKCFEKYSLEYTIEEIEE